MNLLEIREQFPALKRNEIFFDNPGGTQVCNQSINRINDYLIQTNSNKHGAFPTSQASDAVLMKAREYAKTFFNAARYEEVVFGPNMTTLTYQLSRSLAHLLQEGDTVVVTRLDHDANITPWTTIAEENGCMVEWVDFDVETGRLDQISYQRALETNPKLVAIGYASNALGTINPIKPMIREAKQAGALTFIDAVQFAPHGPMDVQELDCDFMAISAYKFFGPHIGMMYGKYEHLAELKAYQLRPAPQVPPGVWETGTQNHEGMAGALGALEYFEWLAEQFGGLEEDADLRRKLVKAGELIQIYELELSIRFQDMLDEIKGVRVHGLTDTSDFSERVPTFSISMDGYKPRELASLLGQQRINVWDGNYYALAVTERLGLEGSGGMLRIGAVHYNTVEEINKLGEEIEKLSK